jgi:putative peptidoglycan lipid II flippase
VKSALDKYDKPIKDASIMSLSLAAMGVCGLLPQIFVAWFLGFGKITDAYFMAFSTVMIFSELFRFGTLQKIYMSFFPAYIAKKDEAGLNKMVSNLFFVSLLVASVFIVSQIILAPFVIKLFAWGFDYQTRVECVKMFRWLTITVVYTLISEIFIAYLFSRHRFKLSSLVQVIPVAFISVFAIFGLKSMGIYALIWAALIGYSFQLLLLGILCFNSGFRLSVYINLRAVELKEIFKMVLPFYIGSVATQGANYIQNLLVSFLSPGSTTVLNYARKLKLYFINYFLSPIPNIMHPHLVSRAAVAEHRKELTPFIMRGLNLSNFVIFPAVILFGVLSPQLVYLVFLRGVLTQSSAYQISVSFIIMAAGLIFVNINSIFARILLSFKNSVLINKSKVIGQAAQIIFSVMFFRNFGIFGIILATMLSMPVELFANTLFLRGYIDIRSIWKDKDFLAIARLNLIFLIFCVALELALIRIFGFGTVKAKAMQIILTVSIGAVFYLALAHLIKINEFAVIKTVVLKNLRNLRPKVFRGLNIDPYEQ